MHQLRVPDANGLGSGNVFSIQPFNTATGNGFTGAHERKRQGISVMIIEETLESSGLIIDKRKISNVKTYLIHIIFEPIRS